MRRRRRKRARRGRWRRRILVAGFALFAVAALTLGAWETFVLRLADLRDPSHTRTIEVPVGTDGSRTLVVGPRNPYWTPLDAVADLLVLCVVKSEDDRFYEHRGFDWDAVRQAFETNVERGRYARGASTITMQLARNLFLWRDKSLPRKIVETYVTWRLEQALPKERILELYLNVAEWGPGIYGIGEASQHYFGKHPSQLTLGESALLAVTLPNPLRWNPQRAPEIALERQQRLLARLRRENALTSVGD